MQKGTVRLEHEQSDGLGKSGREPAGVEDFAACDDQPHGRGPYCPFRTGRFESAA
jgi:hypothetical protein